MKKIFLLAVMAVAGISLAVAQPRAIGGRLGWDPQFSYEHGFGEKNMLSLDAGLFHNFHGVQVAATYDWINPFGADFSKVWDYKGEWNWYLGVGAGAGASFWTDLSGAILGVDYRDTEVYSYVGVAGRVGVEYNFWFPLQLSVDFRPVLGPGFSVETERVGDTKTTTSDVFFHGAGANAAAVWAGGVTLGVRYKF